MRQPQSQPLVLLVILAVTLVSFGHLAQSSSIKLDQVVRALDALYKRQAPTTDGTGTDAPTGAPTANPTTPHWSTSGYGGTDGYGSYYDSSSSGDSDWSGKGDKACVGSRSMMMQLRHVRDYMFLNQIRSSVGTFTGVCVDIFDWLNDHDQEEEWADESSGFDSIPDPVSGETGPSPTPGAGTGTGSTPNPVKRELKMANVKRKLRALKRQMDQTGGGSMDYTGDDYYGGGGLNDWDIEWHRIFLSCYVWMHLSDDYYYYYWKK